MEEEEEERLFLFLEGEHCYCVLPTPYTLHPAPYTLHPTPYTLHPTPPYISIAAVLISYHSRPYTILHPTPPCTTLHPMLPSQDVWCVCVRARISWMSGSEQPPSMELRSKRPGAPVTVRVILKVLVCVCYVYSVCLCVYTLSHRRQRAVRVPLKVFVCVYGLVQRYVSRNPALGDPHIHTHSLSLALALSRSRSLSTHTQVGSATCSAQSSARRSLAPSSPRSPKV